MREYLGLCVPTKTMSAKGVYLTHKKRLVARARTKYTRVIIEPALKAKS